MARLLTPLFSLALAFSFFPAGEGWAADAAAGRVVFQKQCSTCHSAQKGAAPILGPTLWGVVGRPTATVAGFKYSTAMKAAGGVWTEDRLRLYLAGPQKMIPGIRMTYPGLKNAGQLEDLLAWLKTLKG